MTQKIERLIEILQRIAHPVIAVSGGVDSVTLAAQAHQVNAATVMVHARSPAVPSAASERLQKLAAARQWPLKIIDAGEFKDPSYLANPVNRCFFCKSNLYSSMAGQFEGTLCSGANMDDLSDYRPGLKAAEQYSVRHPFVESALRKAEIRQLADVLELPEFAHLPASPCLSSRIETGIAIDIEALSVIERVEKWLSARFGPGDLRCRIRAHSISIEVPAQQLDRLDSASQRALLDRLRQDVPALQKQALRLEAYRRGSAFLTDQQTQRS